MKKINKYMQNRGAILIMVLGMLMVLSLLVSVFLTELTKDIQTKNQLEGKDTLRHYAYNVLEVVHCCLEQKLSRGKNWEKHLYNEKMFCLPDFVSAKVVVSDESGKIPLYKINFENLRCLFSLFGDIWDAQSLAQAYCQWQRLEVKSEVIEAGASAERKLTAPSKAPSEKEENENSSKVTYPKALNCYSQLKAIDKIREFFFDRKGNPTDKWRRFKQCTALLPCGKININSASKDVLEYLAKIYSLNAEQIQQHLGLTDAKQKKQIYKTLEEINTLGHGCLNLGHPEESQKRGNKQEQDCRKYLTTVPQCFRVKIDIASGDMRFALSACYKTDETTSVMEQPKRKKSLVALTLLSLKENFL